ncbi:D-glycero-beta-D-manno-heptose 1,7-bisphosphate 7-phosphatase [Aliidiomarina quisquiliarum]|uniref:D-glycero-beta-D-manno-heptose 1,7-bisphosphate 7-phosphatase n=1 Tax=Aliidiomarina quisquiliarum TaxID=2938947 RepID=UPI00208F0D55|nr:D-glycero-beta-D-manno-heptose 1,7-bisphosphate 7-phosphatase [Aliidiomarina quisquiliarum]MCO4320526.1 D-glycero-beta-D-manno-heptose 1,7-bisphosphate 7-phosphatase [Aliidiomarina quisquiliarum]
MNQAQVHKAVFLDRDGVINIDHGYIYQPELFNFIDGVFDACRHFQSLGYLLVVVTNQSGIGRGYYTEEQFAVLTSWMRQQFAEQGIKISGVYYCPHHAEKGKPPYNIQCNCRKPEPGMLHQAIDDYNIDPSQSIMLGDKKSDMQAAAAAGIQRKVLVLSGQNLTETDKQSADEIWPCIQTGLSAVKR